MFVYRNDTGERLEVGPAALRYGPPTHNGRIALGLTTDIEMSVTGDVPYFQPDPGRPVCVRATIVPGLVEAFKYFRTVPCLEGMQGEVAP